MSLMHFSLSSALCSSLKLCHSCDVLSSPTGDPAGISASSALLLTPARPHSHWKAFPSPLGCPQVPGRAAGAGDAPQHPLVAQNRALPCCTGMDPLGIHLCHGSGKGITISPFAAVLLEKPPGKSATSMQAEAMKISEMCHSTVGESALHYWAT